jgi:hypothetical protein
VQVLLPGVLGVGGEVEFFGFIEDICHPPVWALCMRWVESLTASCVRSHPVH